MNSSTELRDVYTRDGSFTGIVVEKHAAARKGDYFRHVLIIIKTMDSPLPGAGEGMYIVQQRSLKAKWYAGKWDMTGGGVRAGEDPETAAIRELKEELFLEVKKEELKPAFEYIQDWDDGTGLLISVFGVRIEVPREGIINDKYEVNDVRVMPFHEFLGYVMDHNSEEFGENLKKLESIL